MSEKITLSVPETKPSTTFYELEALSLEWPAKQIIIQLVGENGEIKTVYYRGKEAANLMLFLNTADFSVKSLHKRIFEKLTLDKHLSGSVTGTPD